MKIVIDIPEKVKQTFDNAKDEDLYGNYYDYNSLIGKAIQNGTPLPKGHGRLIDANVLCDYFWDNRSKLYSHKDLQIVIDRAETIIEADKEDK